MVREIGAYLQQHDPWQHPRSTGHARQVPFVFGAEDWATYIHIEHAHDLGAAQYAPYDAFAKPVFLGEDRYEQDHGPSRDPADMRCWQRRLFWAWRPLTETWFKWETDDDAYAAARAKLAAMIVGRSSGRCRRGLPEDAIQTVVAVG